MQNRTHHANPHVSIIPSCPCSTHSLVAQSLTYLTAYRLETMSLLHTCPPSAPCGARSRQQTMNYRPPDHPSTAHLLPPPAPCQHLPPEYPSLYYLQGRGFQPARIVGCLLPRKQGPAELDKLPPELTQRVLVPPSLNHSVCTTSRFRCLFCPGHPFTKMALNDAGQHAKDNFAANATLLLDET